MSCHHKMAPRRKNPFNPVPQRVIIIVPKNLNVWNGCLLKREARYVPSGGIAERKKEKRRKRVIVCKCAACPDGVTVLLIYFSLVEETSARNFLSKSNSILSTFFALTLNKEACEKVLMLGTQCWIRVLHLFLSLYVTHFVKWARMKALL